MRALSDNKEVIFSTAPGELGILVFDNPQITITHKAINTIIDNNGAIIICNDKHLPVSFITSETNHFLRAKRIRSQVNASLPKQKNLWKQIVVQKITNQAQVLRNLDKPYLPLLRIASKVKSGDPTNEEAKAASKYWKIFAKDTFPDFSRDPDSEIIPNSALNYGYAVLRAAVARALASAGLLLSYGIFHKSQYNPHALADDLMEPFRPWVDYQVFIWYKENKNSLENNLSKKLRTHLIKTLYLSGKWYNKHYSLIEIAEKSANSLALCLEGKYKKLLLPELPDNEKLFNFLNKIR